MNTKGIAAVIAAAIMVTTALPGVAMAAEKRVKTSARDGRAPARWDLPKPMATPHADIAPPTAGGNGDGYNNITFGSFDSGDIVVVLGTSTGHAGVFDRPRYYNLASYAIVSANVSPTNGVQMEQCNKYRTYPEAYGLWVPGVDWLGTSVRDFCRRQLGEPYSIAASKSDDSRWYCSKLCWAGWYRIASRDLDADGGYWVWPVDLVNSRYTSAFGHWV
jgi:hypothetical protein